jgi:hypothetical protein
MSDDLLNILDSEVAQLGEVVAWAQRERDKGRTSLEAFRRAVVDKFAEVGFRANVKCYDTTEKGVYAFDFEILGRVERTEFDFDRMTHEVRSNLLHLPGDHSVIKTDPAMFRSPVKQKKCGH